MAEQYQYELTTVDNPFDPFEQRESWLKYDNMMGYDTPKTLACFARTNDDELSTHLNQEEINDAITRIIVLDPFNMYKRVRRPMPSYATP